MLISGLPGKSRHLSSVWRAVAAASLSFLAGCAFKLGSFVYFVPAQPEGVSGYTARLGWSTQKFAVAAANPLATNAGYQILKVSGIALDAAIGVQMVLGLVEPQSSGIGSGAFMLYASGGGVKTVQNFDGRETVPAAADEKLFIGVDGKPLTFYEGVIGGRLVGTPGTVKMLEMAHKEHGKLP